MSGRVDRVELRFGLGLTGDGNNAFPGAGHPLVAFNRSGGIVPTNPADWTPASIGNWQAVGDGLSFAACAQNVRLPKRAKSDGPVTAIAISPDSPLDACDLVIGSPSSGNFHRVGVGSPFIGCIDEDVDIFVAPAGSAPTIMRPAEVNVGGTQGQFWGQTTLLWDCFNPIGADGSQTEQKVPLRLNVYRGSYPSSIIKRAPYDALMSYEVMRNIDGLGTDAEPALIVITQGRRRVSIDAGLYDLGGQAGEAASVRVDAGTPKKTTGAAGILSGDAIDDVAWDNLVPATALVADINGQSPFTFDYDGRPYYAFCVSIVNPTAAPTVIRGYINVRAYDE